MDTKERYSGIQTRLKGAKDYACLFLCLCSIAEQVTGEVVDFLGAVRFCQEHGWLAEDYTCNDSLAILKYLTGKQWEREIKKSLTVVADNEYTVEKWFNSRTAYTHFKRRGWDTLIGSVTVKEGYIKEYYVYRHS